MKKINLKKKSNTSWLNLSTMPDSEIDLSDSPELDTSFFENAQLRLPKPKRAVSLRLDDDVFSWFKNQGKGYQTKINAILRLYMQGISRKTTGYRASHKQASLRRTNTSRVTKDFSSL
jgi:uncharacterized protein (DUF4415 family)